MTGRVILFGATGYTGRLTAEAMSRAGLAPVLAGRTEQALVDLVGDLAGHAPMDAPPSWQVATVDDPASVRALIHSPDDVLVSTVGPFSRLGATALDVAIDAGCGYLDSTGEPTFIRHVFEDAGPRAERTGARLLTAFGYDYVPGNLAGALVLNDVERASRVEIGYFAPGGMPMSSGTKASMAAMVGQRGFAFTGGQVVDDRGGVATFEIDGRTKDALPVGGSEHFTLPRLQPSLTDVGVYLGWAGKLTRAASAASTVADVALRIPGASAVARAAADRAGEVTGVGPDSATRATSSSLIIARAMDGVGRTLSTVRLDGPNGYDLTAELLAWGAAMLLTRQCRGVGALGPVDAFGLTTLEHACAEMGLRRA